MAYSEGTLTQLGGWIDSGILPALRRGDRIVELGDQEMNAGTSGAAVAGFVNRFDPTFTAAEFGSRLPVDPVRSRVFTSVIWKRCGLEYLSYDMTEAPGSVVFDLNFGTVPEHEAGRAGLVTNFGTSEHIANQLNVFRVAHDLLSVGGVAIHNVPFAGMLNHGLFNYQPKFFFSLIVNNRYKLRHLEYTGPNLHSVFGAGNTVFDGDYIPWPSWSATPLHTGMMTLVIERRYPDGFVPPVDFAHGYFGDIPTGDLQALVGLEIPPHNAWADAWRRRVTPSQISMTAGDWTRRPK